jgi:hypothetical protein
MYVDGGNLRRIARHLKVHHRIVALWVTNHVEALPAAPMPKEGKEAEMDELFTFIDDKKTELHSYGCRPQNTLYFGLGCGLDTNPGSDSTHDR